MIVYVEGRLQMHGLTVRSAEQLDALTAAIVEAVRRTLDAEGVSGRGKNLYLEDDVLFEVNETAGDPGDVA